MSMENINKKIYLQVKVSQTSLTGYLASCEACTVSKCHIKKNCNGVRWVIR